MSWGIVKLTNEIDSFRGNTCDSCDTPKMLFSSFMMIFTRKFGKMRVLLEPIETFKHVKVLDRIIRPMY